MGKAIAFSFIFVKVLAGILFFGEVGLSYSSITVEDILYMPFQVKHYVYVWVCDNGGNQCGLTPCSFQFPCHAMFWPAANFGLEEIPLFNS